MLNPITTIVVLYIIYYVFGFLMHHKLLLSYIARSKNQRTLVWQVNPTFIVDLFDFLRNTMGRRGCVSIFKSFGFCYAKYELLIVSTTDRILHLNLI